jgi:hypothetical protein
MKRQIKKIAILLTICFVLSITAAAVSAKEENPNNDVVPVESKFHWNPNHFVVPIESVYLGKTYEQWSEKWWKWALSIPEPRNPLLDTTGKNSSLGQSGSVWFLGGTWNGATGVERTTTVPAGKSLFFPIFNVLAYAENGILSEQDIGATKEYIDNVTVKEVRVDGKKLKNLDEFRVRSKIFTVMLPENNILVLSNGKPAPAGPTKSLSDGYWIMLKPLPEGKHTIYIHGGTIYQNNTIESEVTYYLTVKPKRW